jgi:hypothetical protein
MAGGKEIEPNPSQWEWWVGKWQFAGVEENRIMSNMAPFRAIVCFLYWMESGILRIGI